MIHNEQNDNPHNDPYDDPKNDEPYNDPYNMQYNGLNPYNNTDIDDDYYFFFYPVVFIIISLCLAYFCAFFCSSLNNNDDNNNNNTADINSLNTILLCDNLTCDTCSICLEKFGDSDEIKILNCSHIYHKNCLGTWLNNNNNNCPMCRAIIN